ncbi:MAG TPA: Stk1 family PASTA domain-containing Ser/Thr kinase [Sporichthyaceae bacterium]|nr:Stk1 family PASTA domain-containing Ser/Thr kinase [Sporichthyaceae bacterium]
MTEQARLLGERYELSEVLGRGGMAEVRLGRDVRLGRTVAVKTLRSDLALDSNFQARFRREAQSAASLSHPAIVSVYDTGEDYADGVPVPYIVMEYVDGQTLRELLNSGRKLLPERAMEIAAGTLSALEYSHQNGIVHRDIKPGNVMLTRAGTVKVMDFGIARAVSDTSSTMTSTAAVIGTAQYLSPEQAKGEKTDARSDLYSTGCLLYELLTGVPPFVGDSPVAVAYQHVRESPKPPSQVDAAVTPAMDAIVLKALAKNADNRYQSAAEMRDDVERALDGKPVLAPTVMFEAPTEIRGGGGSPTARMPVADGADESRRKWVGRAALLIGVIAVVLLGVFVSKAVFGGSSVNRVEVPAVAGLKETDAENALKAANLDPVVSYQNSLDVTSGLVISQDPAARASVGKGTKINLVISQGEAKSVVPEVVGLPIDQAKTAVTNARLVVGKITNMASDRPKGEVLSSDPAYNKQVKPGTTVNLTVSTGVALVEVPNVVGQPYAQAYAILTQAGFNVPQPSQEISDKVPPGNVLRQVPAAGEKLPAGSNVSIIVAAAQPSQAPGPPATNPTPPATTPTAPACNGLVCPGQAQQPQTAPKPVATPPTQPRLP